MNYRISRSSLLSISFLLLLLVVAAMAAATFAVYYKGMTFGNDYFYHSAWFIILWLLLAIIGCIALFQNIPKRRWPVLMVHLSLIWILFGAFLTHFTGREGTTCLVKGEKVNSFTVSQNKEQAFFPFSVTLKDFRIEYYPGSASIEDYRATLNITDGVKNIEMPLSMNHIAEYRGYRFCISHFTHDLKGIAVMVSRDCWGIPVSYSGYLLFSAAMIWSLLVRGSRFRALLKRMAKYALLLLLVLGSDKISAKPRIIDRAAAEELGRLQIVYNGRIAPVNTLATDFTVKLTGNRSPDGMSADQFFWSWVFFFDDWKKEPVIEIRNIGLRDFLKMGRFIPLTHLFSYSEGYCLSSLLNHSVSMKPDKLQQAAITLNEKVQMCMMLHKGELLKMFPFSISGRVVWLSPTGRLPDAMGMKEYRFVKNIFPLLQRCAEDGNKKSASLLIAKFRKFQEINSGNILLSSPEVEAELFYNSFNVLLFLYRFSLFFGTAGFMVCLYLLLCRTGSNASLNKWWRLAGRVYIGLLLPTAGLLSVFLALRWYITGHIPLSNGYESMLAIAFSAQILGSIFSRRIRILAPMTYLISGFFILVASLSFSDPQISHLMPVLGSPLLSLHVSVIMISYALLSFSFLVSFTSLLLRVVRQDDSLLNRMKDLSLLFIYPALVMLGMGIFIGAVWANVSWGSYWSWDAKEVWALITLLVYSVPLHNQKFGSLAHPLYFHLYVCAAVLTAVMTCFGVNYLLGGMHSYA